MDKALVKVMCIPSNLKDISPDFFIARQWVVKGGKTAGRVRTPGGFPLLRKGTRTGVEIDYFFFIGSPS